MDLVIHQDADTNALIYQAIQAARVHLDSADILEVCCLLAGTDDQYYPADEIEWMWKRCHNSSVELLA